MVKGIEEEMDVSESNSVDVLNNELPGLFPNSDAQTIHGQPPLDFFTLVGGPKTSNNIETTTTDSSTTTFERNNAGEGTKTIDDSQHNWVNWKKWAIWLNWNKLLSPFQLSNAQMVERQSIFDLFNLAGGLQVNIF